MFFQHKLSTGKETGVAEIIATILMLYIDCHSVRNVMIIIDKFFITLS